MRVAALQMVSGTSVAANLLAARRLLVQAAELGAELATLPEYFCLLGRRDTDKLAVQEPAGQGPIQMFLAEVARELSMWIVGGTLPISTTDPLRVRNACTVWSPQGQCVARYDKVHLFRFDNGQECYDEARVLERGGTPVCFDLPSKDGRVWRIGLAVCYDLRFPELFRELTRQGAQVLLVPSAFTYTTGQAHWEMLLRARAVENLAYVLAPAQGGTHENGRRTWGHTLAVDPWGQVMGVSPEGESVVLVELDAAQQQAWRVQLPALEHRVLT